MTDIQLDLFGETAAALDEQAAREARRAEFERRARYYPDGTEVTWTAPYDCGLGRKGSVHPGLRCWLCGTVEPGEYVLSINHWIGWATQADLDRAMCSPQRQQKLRAARGEAAPAEAGEAP